MSEHQEFLNTVAETSRSREVELKEGLILWRAQLGHNWSKEGQGTEVVYIQCAHPPERMKPLPDRATEGRVNPKGIPCLYLSTHKEVALSEVRPWVGAYVSVGQFKLLRNLNLVDCSQHNKGTPIYFDVSRGFYEPEPLEREEVIWSEISKAFSEPMTRSDESADYVATQILSELFKKEGFQGVVYKSNFGQNGRNVALFDLDATELINCGLYRVDGVEIKFSQQDNPYFIGECHNDKCQN
jgi:hypothetical protein